MRFKHDLPSNDTIDGSFFITRVRMLSKSISFSIKSFELKVTDLMCLCDDCLFKGNDGVDV